MPTFESEVEAARRRRATAARVLWRAHYIASAIDSVPDGYTPAQYVEAIRQIRALISTAWGDLGLPRAKEEMDSDEDVLLYADTLGDPDLSREWEPYQHEGEGK